MNNISLDNPYLLLIALPLIVLFTVPFAIAVKKANRNWHNVTSQVLHVVMALLVGFAAAQPNVTTVLTETDVYVVADVSYSANRNLDTIDAYIKNLKLPANSKLGLVCFGKDIELVSGLGDPKKVASVKEARVDDSETNIADALTYTGRLFDTGVIKRIVLITDGKQSDLSDENAIRRAVDELEVQNVKVDAIFLDNNPDADSKEVQISGVTYTETAYLDSKQEAVVEVETSFDTTAVISLTRGGEALLSETAELAAGRNSVSLVLDTTAVGVFDYQVRITATQDVNSYNNTYSFTQTVSDEMKVLVITHSFEDVQAAVARYGEKGEVDVYENDPDTPTATKQSYLSSQAGKENLTFHLNTNDVPFTMEELCKYDQIVLADVDVAKLNSCTAFVSNLDAAVAVLGKSLITFGNLHIQNSENEGVSQLGDMLPVNFGNYDSKLYTIILDTSRSMNQLDHLNLAKELITRLVNTFPENAYLTMITFNSDAQIIQPVTPLSERGAILKKVERLEVIQGTVLGAGLMRTKEYIAPLSFDDKQVLLITDGLSYSGDTDDPVTVAAEMYAAGIVTSVFDVGRQGDSPDGSNRFDPSYQAAYELLTEVAKAGNGRHYYSWNLEFLDEDIFGDMTDNMSVSVIEREATVSVQRLQQNDALLEGVEDKRAMPNVNGYMYCGSKPSATTVLSVNHKRTAESEFTTEKPLLAYQNYGNGRVTTFTSALGGSWVAEWNGTVGNLLFDNMFERNTPKEKIATPYSVNVIREGKITRIEALPTNLQAEASATVAITAPGARAESFEMVFNGSLYYFEFSTENVGKYDVDITYTFRGEDYCYTKAVYVCYLEEYDAFSVFEPSALHRAIDGRGTVSEDGKLTLKNDMNEVGKYVVELTGPLLIVTAVLYVVDIIIRKIKWDDVKNFFGGGRKRAERLAKQKEDKK